MELTKNLSKKKIVLMLLLVIFLGRCVQMKVENSSLNKEIEDGGFKNKYEMDDIKKLGYKSKKEYMNFISGSPIPSEEGEYIIHCAGLSEFFEKRKIAEKKGVENLSPKNISYVLEHDLMRDFITENTPYKIVVDRKEFHFKKYENEFDRNGVTEDLVSNYMACHRKFSGYAKSKCGESGICKKDDESKPDENKKSDSKKTDAKIENDSKNNESGFDFSKLASSIFGSASPERQAGEIVKTRLKSPGSYDFVDGEMLWKGKTVNGEVAYVASVSYDAQNGFGAKIRGCSVVAYRETKAGKIAWDESVGVQDLDGVMAKICNKSIPSSIKNDYAKGVAEANFK